MVAGEILRIDEIFGEGAGLEAAVGIGIDFMEGGDSDAVVVVLERRDFFASQRSCRIERVGRAGFHAALEVVGETRRLRDVTRRCVGNGFLRLLGSRIRWAAVFVGDRLIYHGVVVRVAVLRHQPVILIIKVCRDLIDARVIQVIDGLLQTITDQVIGVSRLVIVQIGQQIANVGEDFIRQAACSVVRSFVKMINRCSGVFLRVLIIVFRQRNDFRDGMG